MTSLCLNKKPDDLQSASHLRKRSMAGSCKHPSIGELKWSYDVRWSSKIGTRLDVEEVWRWESEKIRGGICRRLISYDVRWSSKIGNWLDVGEVWKWESERE